MYGGDSGAFDLKKLDKHNEDKGRVESMLPSIG